MNVAQNEKTALVDIDIDISNSGKEKKKIGTIFFHLQRQSVVEVIVSDHKEYLGVINFFDIFCFRWLCLDIEENVIERRDHHRG